VLEYNFLPEKYSSLIHELEDNMSLYSLLENRFKIGKLNSVKRIGLAKTNAFQSGLLGVKKATPVLYLHEVVYDVRNVPVHRTRQFILGDRFEYIVK
jgi:GntR family transcriptional regulator